MMNTIKNLFFQIKKMKRSFIFGSDKVDLFYFELFIDNKFQLFYIKTKLNRNFI